MIWTGSAELTEQTLTFLCKSSRGLESQKPVLAMVSAGDSVSVSGRCSYLSTGVSGGLSGESGHAARDSG